MGFGWLAAAIISLISATPVAVAALLLGFVKVKKQDMNRDFTGFAYKKEISTVLGGKGGNRKR